VLFGMDQQMLVLFVILILVMNGVGSFVFGWLADRIGCKRSLVIAILMMIGVVSWLFFTHSLLAFFVIGAIAGFAMAGAQSVSRTLVGVFSPPGQSAEFFGLFAVTGRTSSFVGPAIFGFIAAEAALWYETQGQAVGPAEQSGQRLAVLSIAAFLVIGLLLLGLVDETKGRAAAGRTDGESLAD
jgi:UMF1 family MFS transporter